jgi:hypothetical protein
MTKLNIAMLVAGAVVGEKEQQPGQADHNPMQQQQQQQSFNHELEAIKRRQAQQMQCDL